MKTKWKVMTALLGAAGMTQAAMVTIGDAGNTADTTGYGAVGYTYKISVTEVSSSQFAASGAGNGNEGTWGASGPASSVTLYEAMKYCNWLTSGNVNNGVYVFSGGIYQSTYSRTDIMKNGVLDSVATDPNMIYALPTEDEWYKAAYYTGNSGDLWSLYAHELDTAPPKGSGSSTWHYDDPGNVFFPGAARDVNIGPLEQNGTINMMGNVFEWMEDSAGIIRGGAYPDAAMYLASSWRGVSASTRDSEGMRVVEVVPEPATALSLVLGGLVVTGYRRLRKRYGF